MTAADDADRLAQWLLNGVQWKTTVFHAGQYCGRWRASTAGHGLASFHVVLRGRCYLHRPQQPVLELAAGDAVFLLRDEPHHLSSEPDVQLSLQRAHMQATLPVQPDGTALACGFFHFDGPLSAWLLGGFDAPLLLRRGQDAGDLRNAAQVFELMRDEADRSACGFSDEPGDLPSPLLERLTALLFHYVLRHAVRADAWAAGRAGLWSLAQDPLLARLLPLLLESPAQDWSVERMAGCVHMSRAKFFRLFTQACGEPPAQFLQRLRMQLAAQHLHRGDSPGRAAERVGYQSQAAFTRAFSRVLGQGPSAYRRSHAGGSTTH